MRLLLVLLALAVAAACDAAAYRVELTDGRTLTVGGYRSEGRIVRLYRQDMEITVPTERVRHIGWDADAPAITVGGPSIEGRTDPDPHPTPTAADVRRRQAGLERRLLRIQQERFEARARGGETSTLDRSFQRTQAKWLGTFEAADGGRTDPGP